MTDKTHRLYLRDAHRPRAIEPPNVRENRSRGASRRFSIDRERPRPKRSEVYRTSRRDSGPQRRPTETQAETSVVEMPSFELDVIDQPATSVPLGMPIKTSVMVSQKLLSSAPSVRPTNTDTSRLFAMTSLVTETGDGDLIPLEAGSLISQRMFDSIHPFPAECADSLEQVRGCRIALGYFSFPSLLIRQPGLYRIRTTLVRMGGEVVDASATSLLAVDSEPIKVVRYGAGLQRWHQRV